MSGDTRAVTLKPLFYLMIDKTLTTRHDDRFMIEGNDYRLSPVI